MKCFSNFFFQDNLANEQFKARLAKSADDSDDENLAAADDNMVVLSLEHFQGPFAVIIFGWIIGFIILVIEMVIPKCCK